MQYMIMNYVKTGEFADSTRPETDPDGPAWGDYTKALIAADVMRGGNALHPTHAATTVRIRNGQQEVQDGPYAATQEQLGGYYIIEAPNLDAALDWAAKNPAASFGAVEVRPILTM
ncbi:MAG: YciI family protein [Cyanobacteria bacterium P01_A01_bin.17]